MLLSSLRDKLALMCRKASRCLLLWNRNRQVLFPPTHLHVSGPLHQDVAPSLWHALTSPVGASSASGSPTQDPALPWDVWGSAGNLQGKGENQARIWNVSISFYSSLPWLSGSTGTAIPWQADPTQVYRLRLYELHLHSYLTDSWLN